jgi:hypothetical protein
MKNGLIVLFVIFRAWTLAEAQTVNQINTETEAGTDGSGNDFISQYVFFDHNVQGKAVGLSALGRYTNVQDSVHRGEFGLGPNFHFKKGFLNTYLGGTTDQRLMLAVVGSFSLPGGLSFVGISDPKVPIVNFLNGTRQTTTWYRKVWVGKGSFWFRWEDLHVIRFGEAFSRIGGEVRIHPAKVVELYGNPFFDSISGKVGFQVGVRIKLL